MKRLCKIADAHGQEDLDEGEGPAHAGRAQAGTTTGGGCRTSRPPPARSAASDQARSRKASAKRGRPAKKSAAKTADQEGIAGKKASPRKTSARRSCCHRPMTVPAVVVHRDAEALAEAVAARLITRLVDVQSSGRLARIVLTGGTIADRIHRAVAASKAATPSTGAAWRSGGVTSGSSPPTTLSATNGRLETALLDAVRLDPSHVHPMPTTRAGAERPRHRGRDVRRRAGGRRRAGRPRRRCPRSTCSCSASDPRAMSRRCSPAGRRCTTSGPVVGVRGSPEATADAVTMTMPTLQHAHDVWFVVSGEEKAQAVHLALSGAGSSRCPRPARKGMLRHRWLLDKAAARELPAGLQRVGTPEVASSGDHGLGGPQSRPASCMQMAIWTRFVGVELDQDP